MPLPLSWQSLGQLIICFENVGECILELDKKISLPNQGPKKCAYGDLYCNGKNKGEKQQRHGNES